MNDELTDELTERIQWAEAWQHRHEVPPYVLRAAIIAELELDEDEVTAADNQGLLPPPTPNPRQLRLFDLPDIVEAVHERLFGEDG